MPKGFEDLGGKLVGQDFSDLGGKPVEQKTLGGTPQAADFSDLGGKPVSTDFSDLGGVPVKEPSLVRRALDSKVGKLAIKAITPTPALNQAKNDLISATTKLLEPAQPAILKAPDSVSPVEQALHAAKRSLVPIPSPDLAAGMIEATFPTAPLDIGGTIASAALGPLVRILGAKPAVKAAEKVAAMSVEESVKHLDELGRASRGAEPLIKVVQASTPRETIGNLLERQARPRLSAEQALIGLDQTTEATRSVADSAIKKLKSGQAIDVAEGQQISEAVAEAVGAGELDVTEAAKMLALPSTGSPVDNAQMAQIIRSMKSQQGMALAQWARIAKEFKKIAGDKKVDEILGNVDVDGGAMDQFMNGYRYLDNIRKAAMVSQLATTARNVLSQGFRSGINVLEDAASGVMGAVTGKMPIKNALDNAAGDVAGLVHAMSSTKRAELDKVLESFPLAAKRLIGTPIGDVTADRKIASALNVLNSVQENYFRKAAFDARLRQSLSMAGIDPSDLSKAGPAMVHDAVSHALDLTFSKSPTSNVGKWILDGYKNVPVLSALGNPFPRFWMNALRFTYEFSPAPLFRPQTYKAMASSDPRIAFKALNRSMIGSSMIAAGYASDKAGFSGEKWHEFKVGEKRYDMRPFGPYTTSLFMGRLLSQAERNGKDALISLNIEDYTQIFLSMKRTDATGLPILDLLFARSPNEFIGQIQRLVSSYTSSFVPGPVRSAKDFIGEFSREERLPRFAAERPMAGAAMSGIPFLARELPVRPSPFRSSPEERLDPAKRQITGLSARIKTPVEIEADRLGLAPRDIYPKTGMPNYDRMIIETMGPILERSLGMLIEKPQYLGSEVRKRKFIFKTVIAKVRTQSRKAVAAKNPALALADMRKNLEEYLQDDFDRMVANLEKEEPAE